MSGRTTPTPTNPTPESSFLNEFHHFTVLGILRADLLAGKYPPIRRHSYSSQLTERQVAGYRPQTQRGWYSSEPGEHQDSAQDQQHLPIDEGFVPDMAAPASPSQRLPSPPPFPEVQIGPKSPGMGPSVPSTATEAENAAKYDQYATRRIRPGTKAADMAAGLPLIPLAQVSAINCLITLTAFRTRKQLTSP